jgi:protein TonB
VRVGGTIRAPQKIYNVEAVRSKAAADAGIFGMVILEIIIGTDGSVTDAKLLRSIPLLDKAAIDAVKQWRYEVTHLNGQPVPVVMTVTVNFR